MGTDIHLYFEQKNKDGVWERVEVDERLIPDDRHYDVFDFLAGGRSGDFNGKDPFFGSRGVPKDSSFELPVDYSMGDWTDIGVFGFTYVYLDEVLKAPWEENGLGECDFYTFCWFVLPRLTSAYGFLSDEDERNIRILMGFDN